MTGEDHKEPKDKKKYKASLSRILVAPGSRYSPWTVLVAAEDLLRGRRLR